MYFKGKVAIVTGGASGIGEALVRAFAEQGAKVVIADFNARSADTLATELCAMGYAVAAQAVDVRVRKSVDALVTSVADRYGHLDIMVNNAGIVVISELEDTLDEDWDHLIDVNLKGVAYGCRAAIKVMKRQGFGQILNTASSSALAPTPLFTAYSSVKHAVLGLTTALRVEAAASRIKVSALCPGVVDTPVVKHHTSRGLRRARLINGTPFMLSPQRVAQAALKGMKRNRAVIPVGLDSYLPYWANRYFPETYSRLMMASMWLARRYLKDEPRFRTHP